MSVHFSPTGGELYWSFYSWPKWWAFSTKRRRPSEDFLATKTGVA
jgi:hypothetical protein